MGKTIDLRTEVPGPRSRGILARKTKVIAAAKSIYLPVVIDHAHGVAVTDVDGNTFLDWTGGIGCLNVGHTNPAVSEALHRQIDRFLHTDFTMVPYESYVELAERLLEVTPISGPKKAAFFNSGAEAVENAVKLAKLATGRSAVIAFERAFHGRTLMAMSLTSKQRPYKAGMGPFAPEVYRAPYPYPYRDEADDPAGEALEALRQMFYTHVDAENVAAIIFEPVQGEGGFVVPPAAWVRGLREICDEHGIVLIADEVQSGFGRTGKMFGIEHFGVEPDLITVAKSMAAGVPISGVLGRAAIVDRAGDSTIGGTFVGSPLGCVAGVAVLDEIAERDLHREGALERVERIGGADPLVLVREGHPVDLGHERAEPLLVGARLRR
ncbi:MAG: 4-aminobutyrate aminotransferase / (S)-3-amino-2-methylpropionate transaminase / 5-aminovalerate, partial [Gaiellales bacterium]|nr:4-aminobutyrate aminotransferase / (S)-3-amino-2-methylpropionate transaminase / 5-aminovalerate [Gaiellales bacterium]